VSGASARLELKVPFVPTGNGRFGEIRDRRNNPQNAS
jgi:hypothetical protein